MSARTGNENDGVFYDKDVVDGFVNALKSVCSLHDTTNNSVTDSILLLALWQLVDAFENELDDVHVDIKAINHKEESK